MAKGYWVACVNVKNQDEFTLSGESKKDSGIIKLIDNLNNSESILKATLNTMGVREAGEASKQVKIFNISLKINLETTKETETVEG